MSNQINFANKVVFLSGLPLTLPATATDPVTGAAGDLYYNTVSNSVRFYNGSAWEAIQGDSLIGFDLNNHNIIVGNSGNLSVALDTSSVGDILVDSSAGATIRSIQGQNVVGTTGAGHVVFNGSPTLTTPTIAQINNGGLLTLPTGPDTLVGRATIDTLTNKTLSGNTATNLVNGSGVFNFNSSGTITVPSTTDQLVGRATTDTLTNKTIDTGGTNLIGGTSITGTTGSGSVVFSVSPSLTTPSFSSIINTGTLTLPTSTDTLVGRATIDTLTNKTLSTGGTNLIGATTISGTTGTGNVVFSASPTFTGTVGGTSAQFSGSIIAADFASGASNPAASGVLRLASTDAIAWRNNANSADVLLAKNTSDQLTYAGTAIFSSSGILLSSAFPALIGDVTTTAGSLATTISANAVTYAKFQQVTADTLVGNPTSGTANTQAVTLGATLTFSGSALQTTAFTGDVTTSANSFATTISSNAVTYSKFQQVAADSLVGNPTGTLANAQGITLGATLTFVSTTLETTAMTGDVTTSANSFATTISSNVVTYAKFQQVAADSLVGNPTGSTANAQGITLGATLTFVGSVLETTALTSDVTSSANSFATTVSKIQGNTVSGTTGTGNVVFSIAPTFTTSVSFTGGSLGNIVISSSSNSGLDINSSADGGGKVVRFLDTAGSPVNYSWLIGAQFNVSNGFEITPSTAAGGSTFTAPVFKITQSGTATFSGTVTANGGNVSTITSLSGGAVSLVANNTHAATSSSDNNTETQLFLKNDAGFGFRAQVYASGASTAASPLVNGPTGVQAALFTDTSYPLVFGTANSLALTISTSQNATFYNSLTVSNTAGVSTPLTIGGNATNGLQIQIGTPYMCSVGTLESNGGSFLANNAYQPTYGSNSWLQGSATFTSSLLQLGLGGAGSATLQVFAAAPGASGTFASFWGSSLFTIDSVGNVVVGNAAISTSATNGFLYLPTCAGAPVGTPNSYSGRAPVVVDSTDGKFYFYSGGAWNTPSGGGGGGSAWPTQFAASESALATAITACSSSGGVICINGSFSITSAHTIPTNTTLVGQMGASVITVGSGGSLTFSDFCTMEHLYITTALTSGTLITASGNGCRFDRNSITVPGTSTTVAINVTGSNNLFFNSVFHGVAGGSTGIGIQYSSGSSNADQYCVFTS